MNSSAEFDHDSFARRHRGGMLLERHNVDLFVHPFLGFCLPPNHRSAVINTDEEGFRLSDSPFGTVDSATWLSTGGGGIVLGNSVAIGLAASSDSGTPASHLAASTGSRWLNLGVCAAISLQELIVAVPFLHAASTVVIIGGGPDLVNQLGSTGRTGVFGAVSYERTVAELTEVPMFDLATLATGRPVADLEATRRPREATGGWNVTDAPARMEAAASRRLRDLAVLSRAAGGQTRILFCLQPYASSRTRTLTPQEKARYDFDAPVFGILHGVYEKQWQAYADRLAEGCAELGVSFLNLAADLFVGDCFADNAHLNDEGNRQAAELILQALEKAPDVAHAGAR